MSTETTVLGLSALLQVAQIGLAGYAMHLDDKDNWNVGPRDTTPDFSPLTGRLRRAVANHFEALAFFIIAVVMLSVEGHSNTLTAFCAWLYLAARILYVPAYAFGWTPWRSVIWVFGFAPTLVMILYALFV